LTVTHSRRSTLLGPLLQGAAVAVAVALLLALTPAAALAQDAGIDGADGIGGGAGIGGDWDWIGLGVRLAIVLAAIWAVIVAMRWYVRRTGGVAGSGGRTRHLEVLETRSLGGHRSLQLVRLGERAVLLGVTAERITALLEVDDPAELAAITAPEEPGAQPRSFSSFLAGMGGSLLASQRALREKRAARRGAAAPVQPVRDGARRRAAAAAYEGMRVVDLQRALEEPLDAPRAS
jgi:flagellar biosynthetic protein FliO